MRDLSAAHQSRLYRFGSEFEILMETFQSCLMICCDFVMFQVLWTFSIYLESVAILPQLFLVSKTGEAESITSHYLFALGSYRALYILNWVSCDKSSIEFDTRLLKSFADLPICGGKSLWLDCNHRWHHPDNFVLRLLLPLHNERFVIVVTSLMTHSFIFISIILVLKGKKLQLPA